MIPLNDVLSETENIIFDNGDNVLERITSFELTHIVEEILTVLKNRDIINYDTKTEMITKHK